MEGRGSLMKRPRPSLTLAIGLFFGVSLFSAVFADGTPALKKFNAIGTQYTMLEKSFYERALHNTAGFYSCVRRLYSTKELIEHPLPDSAYEILSFFKGAMTPDRRNTFSFLNSHGEDWKCAIHFGYCMSMSNLDRDLNTLLIFDPKQSLDKLPKFTNDQAKSEYYENILFDVWLSRKPAVIPGFADLNSFSVDPIIKNIFMGAVPMNLGDLASIPKIAVDVAGKSRVHISEAEMISEIGNMKAAKEKGYNPLMYLGGVESPANGFRQGPPDFSNLEAPVAPKPAGVDIAPNESEIRKVMTGENSPPLMAEALHSMATPKIIGGLVSSVKDSDHTYIHVVQVLSVEEISPRKWVLTAQDPNGFAPYNIGKLTVDLDAKDTLYFQGASATINLNSFGQLPGDREHMDEIVANLTDYAKAHPEIFVKPPAVLKP
jgi:hypothetical protein